MSRNLSTPARWVLAAAAGVLVVAATAVPAQAHAELLGTSPGKGETVKAPPDIVALQFSEQVLEIGLTVQVTGPAGRVDDGKARLAGAAVVQTLKPGLPAGAYTVVYRVTSDDGHPIEGSFGFEASGPGKGAAAGPTASSGSSASTGSPSTGSTAPASPSVQPSPTTSLAVVPVSGSGGGSPPLGWTIVGIVIVVAGLGAALLALRRPRRGSPPAPGPGAAPQGPPTG